MLLCDRCNDGYHIYCLPLPLDRVPRGAWYCEGCVRVLSDQAGGTPIPHRWSSPSVDDVEAKDEEEAVRPALTGPAGLGAAYRIQARLQPSFSAPPGLETNPGADEPCPEQQRGGGLITSFFRGSNATVDAAHMDAKSSIPRAPLDPQRPITSFFAPPRPGGVAGLNQSLPSRENSLSSQQASPLAHPPAAVAAPAFVKCPRCEQMVARHFVDSHIREYGRRGVCTRRFGSLHVFPEHPTNGKAEAPRAQQVPCDPGGQRLGSMAARGPEISHAMRTFKPVDGEDCTICLEGLSAAASALLGCKHAFHRACIVRWAKQQQGRGAQCPVCRKVFLPAGATLD